MDGDTRYSPVACGFHDRLEAMATLGRSCAVRYREPDGEEREVVARIEDIYAAGGEEFVRLSGGEVVRLDRLIEVEPVAAADREVGS
jgi:Rho-binding antiterminator